MILNRHDFSPEGLILSVLHVTLAGAVTAHALLRKRAVRSAIAWIGLAWLSPLIGAALYYVFGVNRVSRKASRLFRGVAARQDGDDFHIESAALPESIETLASVVARLTGRPLSLGNALSTLHCGDEAYPAMLHAIRMARHSIALASYIFRDDRVGRAFADALAAAQARGVEVRVLVDGIGSGYLLSPIVRYLRKKDVPVARFLHHWLPWRMAYLNLRSHRKLLIVDGTIGFTGGMNISNENVLANDPPDPVSDVHFRVDGPVVRDLMLTFAEDWDFTTGEVLSGDAWWPALKPAGAVCARGVSSGPDEAAGRLGTILATAITAARRRLRIVTPYFLPDDHVVNALELAALRGIEVEVVLPERSDHLLIDWAMRGHLAFMVRGIRFYLSPPPFDHAKLMTIDGRWVFIGSANWDVRSMRLSFEFGLECYDAPAAASVDRVIDTKIGKARPLPLAELAARPMPIRLRDGAARLLFPYL